ncbi:hypothetical protein Tco_1284165 [Tanacetum coccineum]
MEDTAYLCLHFTGDHEGTRSNTPYSEELNTPYSSYIMRRFWKISNVVPTLRNPRYAVSKSLDMPQSSEGKRAEEVEQRYQFHRRQRVYHPSSYSSIITGMELFDNLTIKDPTCVLHIMLKMTTTVRNSSVFRSFFEKQKLTGPNFIDWYKQLRLVLSTEDKENYLEHPIPAAPVAPPGQQVPPAAAATHAAWVKRSKEVVVLMLLTMELDLQRNLAHLGAYDIL